MLFNAFYFAVLLTGDNFVWLQGSRGRWNFRWEPTAPANGWQEKLAHTKLIVSIHDCSSLESLKTTLIFNLYTQGIILSCYPFVEDVKTALTLFGRDTPPDQQSVTWRRVAFSYSRTPSWPMRGECVLRCVNYRYGSHVRLCANIIQVLSMYNNTSSNLVFQTVLQKGNYDCVKCTLRARLHWILSHGIN